MPAARRRRVNHRSLISIAGPATALLVALSCAATPLHPGAEHVVVGNQPPPAACKFVGTVVGQQGGVGLDDRAWSGYWTSNRNLAQGALNEVRNEGQALGANYVLILSTTAGTGAVNAAGASVPHTDVTHTASAYKCPPGEIGLE